MVGEVQMEVLSPISALVLGVGKGRHMAEVGSWPHSYWGTHTLHGHHDTTHPGSRIDGYITTRFDTRH